MHVLMLANSVVAQFAKAEQPAEWIAACLSQIIPLLFDHNLDMDLGRFTVSVPALAPIHFVPVTRLETLRIPATSHPPPNQHNITLSQSIPRHTIVHNADNRESDQGSR